MLPFALGTSQKALGFALSRLGHEGDGHFLPQGPSGGFCAPRPRTALIAARPLLSPPAPLPTLGPSRLTPAQAGGQTHRPTIGAP